MGFPLVYRTAALLSFIFVICLIISCSAPKPPSWIHTQPDNSEFWFGYGIVHKPFGGDIREEARSRAIEEIASQISIQISSQMEHIITEHNYDVNEYTRSLTETRVNSNLENIEIVETYNGKEEFILLAKLSRQKYYNTVRRKRLNSVETSLGYIQQADEAFTGATFSLLEQALTEIRDYLDEPILVEYPAGSGYNLKLYPLIQLKISDYFSRISLTTDPEYINVTIGIYVDKTITVKVIDKETDSPIMGIPLTGSLANGNKTLMYTDVKGEVKFMLTRIQKKAPLQSFEITVQNDKLISSNNYNTIKTSITINATSPLVSIQSSEKNLGKQMETAPITEGVKQLFQKIYGAEFTTDKIGDIAITLNANTEKRSNSANEHGLFVTLGNVTISIFTQDGNELFSTALTGEMGRSFSNHRDAGLDAIHNMQKKVISQLKSELEKVLGE